MTFRIRLQDRRYRLAPGFVYTLRTSGRDDRDFYNTFVHFVGLYMRFLLDVVMGFDFQLSSVHFRMDDG